jgi:hypothetical protein
MLRAFQIASSWALMNVLLVVTAPAQEKRELPETYPWWNIRAGLIGYKQVRDELRLTDDQMREIGEVAVKHAMEVQAKLNALDRTTRRESDKIIRESIEHVRRFEWNDYLAPDQAARFRQIQLWVMRHQAFNEPDVAKELELTEPQKNALKTIGGEFSNALYQMTRDDYWFAAPKKGKERETVEKEQKQLLELIAAKEKECRAALTDEQNARFDKLRGPIFEPIFRMTLGEMVEERGP